MRFTSGAQYGSRVWSKGLTTGLAPYVSHDQHCVRPEAPRSTPTYEVAAAASRTIESVDAKQLTQGYRVFEVRYANKHSAILAIDFVADDIQFTAAAPNALLRHELLNSVVELLDAELDEQDKPLVAILQLGTSLGSREQLKKFERMYNSINSVMDSNSKVREWVDATDMEITPTKKPSATTPVSSPIAEDVSPQRDLLDDFHGADTSAQTGTPPEGPNGAPYQTDFPMLAVFPGDTRIRVVSFEAFMIAQGECILEIVKPRRWGFAPYAERTATWRGSTYPFGASHPGPWLLYRFLRTCVWTPGVKLT